jgi:hypothetical protein
MRLQEWKDSSGKKVSTASTAASASSGSFKKRLNKLINYYGQHHPAEVDFITVNLLTGDTLDFTEYYDDRSTVRYNIYIGPATEAWRLKITAQGKLKDDLLGIGWPELLKTLRAYITVPVVSTPDYKDLLVEYLDKNGKKINLNNSSTSSQPASSSTPNNWQKYRYNRLLAQIDADGIATYTVNAINDTILDITTNTKSSSGLMTYRLRLTITYYPDDDYYILKWDTKEHRCEDFEDALKILIKNAVIANTDLCESCSLAEELERIPKKLYHATYKQFLKSIQQKGLGNTKRKMWSDSKTGVVYLADDPWVAESYAETAEWPEDRDDPDAYYDNIIILEIDTTKLDPSKLKVDENVLLDEGEENSTWEYHDIIPWDAIKIFDSSIAEDFKLYENLWD